MSTELSDFAKTSVRSSYFLFLGNTSSTIIMAFASIIVGRLLGPEGYGIYTVAMIAPSFLIVLSDLGISPALIRFSAHFRSEGKSPKALALIRAGIIFKLIFSLILSLILLLCSDSIATQVLRRPDISLLICFTSFYLVGNAVFTTLNHIFIGLDKTENSGLLMNVEAITKIVVSPILIILGMGTLGAILGTGLGFMLAATFGVAVIMFRIFPSFNSHNNGENIDFFQGLKLMVSYGMPLYISNLVFSLLAQYQHFTLVLFVSNVEIGNYSIAMNISVLITILSYPIASLFPAFSKLKIEEDQNKMREMFKLSVKYTSLLIIPASLVVSILSKEIVSALYGSQYQLAPSYLTLYILSFLCAGLGMFVVDKFFNSQGDAKATLTMRLINLGIFVPAAFILTFLYGVFGLLVSILASELLSTIYGLFLARKKYTLTVDLTSSLRIGAASLSSALIGYIFIVFFPIPNPILKVVAGGCLYIISFLVFTPLLEVVKKEDIKNLDEALKGLFLIYPIAKYILNFEEKILSLAKMRKAKYKH